MLYQLQEHELQDIHIDDEIRFRIADGDETVDGELPPIPTPQGIDTQGVTEIVGSF